MVKSMKTGDYAVIVLVIVVVCFLFYHYVFSAAQGKEVQITARAFQRSFSIDDNRIIEAEGPLGITRVVIKDGEVWVSDSPCREKLCIKMGKKKRAGEQIICIPNRVFVEVIGQQNQVDGVTR